MKTRVPSICTSHWFSLETLTNSLETLTNSLDTLTVWSVTEDLGAEIADLEEDIKVEMEWCQTTEKTIDDLLVKVPPKEKQQIELNVRVYDVSYILILVRQIFEAHIISKTRYYCSQYINKCSRIK